MQNRAVPKTGVRLQTLQRARVSSPNRSREYRNWPRVRATTEETNAPVVTKDEPDGGKTRPYYTGKRALVVGSGPAGSVAAAFLAKQGFDVEVYEKRDDPTQAGAKVVRPVPMSLTQATTNVVKSINIELPSSEDEYKNGLRRHGAMSRLSKDGQLVTIPLNRQDWFVATRHDLAKNIITNVRDKNPEKITFHFEHPCIDVDLTKQQVQFRDHDNNIGKQDYDLLVGADGANSEVRKEMEKEIKDFKVSTTMNSSFYKVYVGLPVIEEAVPEEYKLLLEPSHVSVCQLAAQTGTESNLRTFFMSRIDGGDLTGFITGSAFAFERIKGKEKEYLTEVMPDWFPEDWIDRLAAQLKDNPVNRWPSITEVSSLVGPSVVLIGDAGHSVSTALGQGCNMAVQDCQFLNDALDSARGDISLALREFNQSRFKAVRQTQALELVAAAPFLEHKGIRRLLPILVKMHTVLHTVGNKFMPWLVPRPVIARFQQDEVSVDEAIQILKAELVALLVITAAMLYVFVKAMMSVF